MGTYLEESLNLGEEDEGNVSRSKGGLERHERNRKVGRL